MSTNILQIREPSFYHRDTRKDLPEEIHKSDDNLPLRVISAVLPVLSLYRPIGKIFQGYTMSKNI